MVHQRKEMGDSTQTKKSSTTKNCSFATTITLWSLPPTNQTWQHFHTFPPFIDDFSPVTPPSLGDFNGFHVWPEGIHQQNIIPPVFADSIQSPWHHADLFLLWHQGHQQLHLGISMTWHGKPSIYTYCMGSYVHIHHIHICPVCIHI